jgi:hypothetical protein
MKGHIRERSAGHWAIVLDIGDTAKRRRKWHSFRGTKRQAQIECARLISEVQSGNYLEPAKTTLAQFLDRWLVHMQRQISPKSHERYSEIVRKNIIPALGRVVLMKLRPAQISEAYDKALANGRADGQGGLAPASVVYMHRLLKKALAQAVRWGVLQRNPVDAVDPPQGRAQPHDHVRYGANGGTAGEPEWQPPLNPRYAWGSVRLAPRGNRGPSLEER